MCHCHLHSLTLFLGVHKEMWWNDHKGMNWNIFKQRKKNRKEMNEMEWNYVTLFGCFKIKEWKLSNLVWELYKGKWMKSFYDTIIFRPLFQNKMLNI